VQNGVGYVVVFDDISNVISAQRSIAWGEVARRLAHEIKNPLTPIQLSAERLQHRLADKLMPADAAMLDKGTTTIVNQVTAMKRMVDDFRDYAKTPPAKPVALDLNALIEEILNLYLAATAAT
jgi:nitrogen fixation/metabolism regulation signal transduction histidine kinase